MTAGIYANKCVVVRTPAWHRLGFTAPEPLTAREAVACMGGLPSLDKRRLAWPDGTPSPWYGLGRVGDDGGIAEGFATVSADYRMVTLDEFLAAWEVGTDNAPIETMAVLNGGRIFFITTPLPSADVLGDEINRYLSVANFNDGVTANACQIADIRWVCQNTLFASLRQSQTVFRVAHDCDVMADLTGWLQDAYQTARQKAEAVREALELLAGYGLPEAEASETVEHAIPLPGKPRPTGSPQYDARREEAWLKASDRVLTERATVLALWRGDGLGMQTLAAGGTAFGMYNALAEAYEYVVPSTNTTLQARSYLFGERRAVVQRGFDYLLYLARP